MAIWIINNLFPIFSFKLAKEANNTCFCFVFCFGQKKSLFSIPEGTNLTVLVPVKEAIQNLSKDEKDFWLQPDMLLLLVRYHWFGVTIYDYSLDLRWSENAAGKGTELQYSYDCSKSYRTGASNRQVERVGFGVGDQSQQGLRTFSFFF